MNFLGSRTPFDYGTILLTRDRALNIVKTQSPFPSACSNWPCCSCATNVKEKRDDLQISVIKKCRENEEEGENREQCQAAAFGLGKGAFVRHNFDMITLT